MIVEPVIQDTHKLLPSYLIHLDSLDGINSVTLSAEHTVLKMNEMILTFMKSIPYGRVWNLVILTNRCGGVRVSNTTELSKAVHHILHLLFYHFWFITGTHDIQNVYISNSNVNEIRVSCEFLTGSLASGLLVILYTLQTDSFVYYWVIPRLHSNVHIIEKTLNNLPGNLYSVSVFTIMANGLPFTRAATVPKTLSLVGHESKLNKPVPCPPSFIRDLLVCVTSK